MGCVISPEKYSVSSDERGFDRIAAENARRPRLLVNPYDAESVANAIAQALAMPLEERRARHQELLAVISDYDVDRWQREFLIALRSENGSMHDLQNMPETVRSPSGGPVSLYPDRIDALESRG